MMKKWIIVFFLCMGSTSHYADSDTFVELMGESVISIIPQEIHLTLTLERHAWNAKEAKTALSHDVENVLNFIHKQKTGVKPVKTSFVSVMPKYENENAKRDFLGYFSSTVLTIVFLDEELYYTMMDKLPKLVEDYRSHIQFEIGNVEGYHAQLKIAAIRDAKLKATLLAETAGARLGKVLQIKDVQMSRPGGRLMATRSSVRIEAGEEELRAQVFLRYELLY